MGRCRRHPYHVVVGVCAYCLSEQLSGLLKREDDGRDGSSYVNTHLHTHYAMHSPHAFTPSNPSTTCGTMPETPSVAPRRAPPRLPHNPSVDDVSPNAASQQCFSLSSFSPRHRLKSDTQTPSYVCSPQSQVFLGNHDFIKGEIPRKKKTSFWSFLHRRKAGFYNTCGVPNMGRKYVLDQDATYDPMYDDDNHLNVQQNGMHKDMHSNGEKTKLDRHILSKVVSSSAYIGIFGRNNPALRRVSLPQRSASPNHYLKYPYPSKQKASSFFTPGHRTIGLSPLRHKKYGTEDIDDDDVFSQGLWSAYAADGYGNAKSNYAGLSSSCGSNAIFPQKMRRSLSISGLSDVSDFEPTIELTCQSSPDTIATRARSVSCANEEMNGSPKGMLVKTPQGHVNKTGHHKSLNSYRQDTGYNGHRKSPKSSSPCVLHHANAVPESNQNLEAFSKPEAHKNNKSPHLFKPAISILSRSRPEPVSIECGKATRVSPLMLAVHKKTSGPHSLIHGTQDRLPSPCYCNHHVATQTHGDADGDTLRYMPPYQQGLEDSSTMPSDDECQRSPSLSDLNLKKQRHSQSRNSQALKEKVGLSHHSKEQIKEPAFGSHVFAYSTTRSWSKALGNMLGIRRGKKQSIKVQAVSPNDHAHLYHMEKMHNMCSSCHQILHNADDNDGDDSDFIDYDQSELYDDHYPPQHMWPSPRECANAHHLQATESQVLPGWEELKGPPQQYSFLSKDYSTFSCYFSPPQAFQKAEVATQMGSYTKQMQVGKGVVCMPKSTSLLSSGGAMHGIRGRSGRG